MIDALPTTNCYLLLFTNHCYEGLIMRNMTTLEQLQHHLAGEVKTMHGYEYKLPVPHLRCADGTTASVQASQTHYCEPRSNVGPYTEVEVWRIDCPVTEFDYETEEPSAYIDITKVVQFIDNHGGFATVLTVEED